MGDVVQLKLCKIENASVVNCGDWCLDFQRGERPYLDDGWQSNICSKVRSYLLGKFNQVFESVEKLGTKVTSRH